MKQLRQYIRHTLLTENIHPKIEGMIQRLRVINADEDIYEHMKIEINIESHGYFEVKLLKTIGGKRLGIIEAVKYSQECLDAFEVVWASERNLGLGPLLYDITMEVASQYGTGLMCDRSSVSDAAFEVWNKYLYMRCNVDKDGKCKSPDIEIMQLDNNKWPKTPQPEDDCKGVSSIEHYPVQDFDMFDEIETDAYLEYWQNKDPLAKVYIKKRPAVIRRLLPHIIWRDGSVSIDPPGWV